MSLVSLISKSFVTLQARGSSLKTTLLCCHSTLTNDIEPSGKRAWVEQQQQGGHVAGDEEKTLVLEERLSLPSAAAFVGPYCQIVSGLDEFKNKSNETKILQFRPQTFGGKCITKTPSTSPPPPMLLQQSHSMVFREWN